MRNAASLLIALLLSMPASAVASSVVLDAMTDLLDPSVCLPLTSQPVVFLGTFCDGDACPPDPLATFASPCNYSYQDGLAGIFQQRRRTTALGGDPSYSSNARVRPELARMEASFGDVAGNDLLLAYDRADAPWNLDLAAMGATALRVGVYGDVSPAHPLLFNLTLANVENFTATIAEVYVTVTAEGELVVPFATLVPQSGFDYSSVEQIVLDFAECFSDVCPGITPRQFSIGPVTLDVGGPTAARRTSWGRLKMTYR